jgi:hypothetical protein
MKYIRWFLALSLIVGSLFSSAIAVTGGTGTGGGTGDSPPVKK